MNLLKELSISSTKKIGIEFVGANSIISDGSTSDIYLDLTSLSGGIDTQPSEGDLVVLYYGVGGTSSYNGYFSVDLAGSSIIINTYTTDSYRVKGGAIYKIIGATPDTSIRFAGGTHSVYCGGAAIALVFRGVNQTTPIDVLSTYALINNTVLGNPPAITPATPGAVVLCGALGASTSTGVYTSSDLTGFTSVVGASIYRGIAGVGYVEWAGGSPVDAAQFGYTSSNSSDYSNLSVTIALRPA